MSITPLERIQAAHQQVLLAQSELDDRMDGEEREAFYEVYGALSQIVSMIEGRPWLSQRT